ncbi:glutathione S-transferase [Pseudomonas phytophila]|uniref:Glutathione S-transferase n=1 Tax=Pseudomonas phytophila TaxID=2867264 RepID=A0ABY6FKU1_9PSED|nr:glutathione S-transferase [Pseudomonas phytophila]UXZ98259.1 glutathione S-transferase [Pseudomonas phytophila]
MYTLFGAEGSGSAAIEIALKYCGADYRLQAASSWEEGSGRDELRRINPLLQVPTLVLPDGTVLTESAAILTCLGLGFPASGLLSLDPSERAIQLRGLVYIASNCYAAIGVIDYPERWLPGGNPDQLQQLVNGARSRLYGHWDTFSDVFGGTAAWRPDKPKPGAVEILACVVTRWAGTREYLQLSRSDFHASLLDIDCHVATALA